MSKDQDGEKRPLRERWKDIGPDQYREEMDRRRRDVGARKKVSSADMDQVWQRRREQWSASMRGRSFNLGLMLRVGVGSAALIAAALMTSNLNSVEEAAEASAAGHQAQVETLQREIAALEIAEDDGSAAALQEALDGYLTQARTAGTEVAQLQNQFAEILAEANGEERMDQIGPYPAEIRAAAHREQLSEFWDESSLMVEADSTAYGVNQFDPFASFEMDPRYAWYSMMTEPRGADYAAADDYVWELASTMPDTTGTPELIEVAWLNRRDDGWLLAWASATYDAELEVFSDLEVGRTSTGVEFQHWGANHDYDDTFSDEDVLDADSPEGDQT